MTKLAILEVDNGDIVHPDERLRAVIRTSNNPTEVLYLFLMHLSFLTKQPVQPDHDLPFQAPFTLNSYEAKIVPAYLVKKGKIHYGYQISSADVPIINLRINLAINPSIKQSISEKFYELMRFVVFNESGTFHVQDFHDLAIIQFWPKRFRQRKLANKEKLFKGLPNFNPLPFYQSPSPHPDFIKALGKIPHPSLLKPGATPSIISVGDENSLYVAKYLPKGTNFKSIINVTAVDTEPLPKFPIKTLNELAKIPTSLGDYFAKIYENFLKPTVALKMYIIPSHLCPKPYLSDQSTQTEGIVIVTKPSHKPNNNPPVQKRKSAEPKPNGQAKRKVT
jgi:hypothetical protein